LKNKIIFLGILVFINLVNICAASFQDSKTIISKYINNPNELAKEEKKFLKENIKLIDKYADSCYQSKNYFASTYLYFFIATQYYYDSSNYIKSKKYLDITYQYKKYLNSDQKYHLYSLLSNVEVTTFNYINAIFFNNKSYELAQKENNKSEIFRALIELGWFYKELGLIQKSYEAFHKALNYQPSPNESPQPWNRIILKCRLAEIYMLQNKNDSAYLYINNVLKSHDLKKDSTFFPLILDVLVRYRSAQKNYQEAINIANIILELTQNDEGKYFNNAIIRARAFFLLSENQFAIKDSINALKNLKNSFEIVKENLLYQEALPITIKLIKLLPKNDPIRDNVFLFFSMIYEKNNDYLNKTKTFSIQYEELRQKDLVLKNKELELENRKQLVFILAIAIAILGFYFFKIYNKNNIIYLQKKQLENSNKELQKVNVKLSAINEELDKFSSVVAHDIKSSIVEIMQNVKNVNNKNNILTLDEIQKEMDKIDRESKKLYEFIDFLLATARNTKNINVYSQQIDFESILNEVKESLQNSIILTDAQITLQTPSPVFHAYKVHIFQLFKNLIENAIKYSKPSEPPKIEISFETKKSFLIINIKDNGLGIPKEKQKDIFEMFVQSRFSDANKGSGIGLNICKKIVMNYNGKINVNSTEGIGTTFRIILHELK
jgi:signal transduction histidine kinase